MKRVMVFLLMSFVTLIDVPWALYNILFGGLIYGVGALARMPKLALYGRNIVLSVDQFFATKHLGQDPDVTISMALGVAKYKHDEGIAKVGLFIRYYAHFVNFLFAFQKNHVFESIEKEESAKGTVIHLYQDSTQDPDWAALDKEGATPASLAAQGESDLE